MRVYVCEICHGVNHAAKLSCSTCGTIPRQYSITGKAMRIITHQDDEPRFTEVVPAFGAERQEDRRGRKLYFRTVPADYFAS